MQVDAWRYAWRGWMTDKVSLLAIVLVVGLGVGVNLLMAGAVERLLLSGPGGVPRPTELFRVGAERVSDPGQPVSRTVSFPFVQLIESERETFDGKIAAFLTTMSDVGEGELKRRTRVAVVSNNYFAVLEVRALAGQVFGPNTEGSPDRGVIVGWARFKGEDHRLGDVLRINGKAYTIIGVTPPEFTGIEMEAVDIWLPLTSEAADLVGADWQTNPRSSFLQAVGRLQAGVLPETAQARLTVRLAEEVPAFGAEKVSVLLSRYDRADGASARRIGQVATTLSILSLFLLVAALANAAGIIVSRSEARKRDLAIRQALGASSAQVLRHLAFDAVIVVGFSVAVGIALVHFGSVALRTWFLPTFSWGDTLLGPRVLVGSLAEAMVALTVLTLMPWLYLRQTKVPLHFTLASGENTVGKTSFRFALLGAQVAVSIFLISGAGLFVSSLQKLRTENIGFDAQKLIVVDLGVEDGRLPPTTLLERLRQVRQDLEAVPGVEGATITSAVPFERSQGTWIVVPHRTELPSLPSGGPYVVGADENFVGTMGIQVIQGRSFDAADIRTSRPVMLINETMKRFIWDGTDPVGSCVTVGPEPRCREVIGVVADTKRDMILEGPTFQFFVPIGPDVPFVVPSTVILRAERWPPDLQRHIRAAFEAAGLDWSTSHTDLLGDLMNPELRAWKLAAAVFTGFGVISFLVLILGVGGGVARVVRLRRLECAIHAALGAGRMRLAWILGRNFFRSLIVGTTVGLVSLGLVLPFLGPLLVGQTILDLMFHASVAMTLLTGVTAIALAVGVHRAGGRRVARELARA